MNKAITISIPEPCHENWQEMNATEKGKFCDSCAKEVFDFTDKNDDQIAAFVTKHPNACGRFKKNQTDRALKMERKSGLYLAPYAASLLLPLSLLGNSNPTSTTYSPSKSEFVSLGIGRFSVAASEQNTLQYSGIIRDESGNSIPNSIITVKETGASVTSGNQGQYKITSLKHQTLTFQKKGFEPLEIRTSNYSEEKNIVLFSLAASGRSVVGKVAINPVETKTVTIQGTLTDDEGIPLPGVTIIVRGTTIGTQSDFDGMYSIEATPGSELVYSYVGYRERRVTIANIDALFNIQMEASFDLMGEMVVIAGGISVSDTPAKQTPEEKAAIKLQRETANRNQQIYRELTHARKKKERLERRNDKRN